MAPRESADSVDGNFIHRCHHGFFSLFDGGFFALGEIGLFGTPLNGFGNPRGVQEALVKGLALGVILESL